MRKGAYNDFEMKEKAFFYLDTVIDYYSDVGFPQEFGVPCDPEELDFFSLGILWPFRKSSGSSPGLYPPLLD